MNVVSIDRTRRYGRVWAIEVPSFISSETIVLEQYVVQKGEDMRIDLVVQSIYGEETISYGDVDVILYINGIDNPINIREGMVLLYPPEADLLAFRYEVEEASKTSKSVKERLGVLNQTTRKDEKRKKFLEADYSLPPVVLKESRPGVIITPTEILIGGVK
jgi:hypothetical protein